MARLSRETVLQIADFNFHDNTVARNLGNLGGSSVTADKIFSNRLIVIKEAIEIKLQPDINRDGGYIPSRAWQPVLRRIGTSQRGLRAQQ
jgi:hypothetical protein